jgi:serine O-acetyltransferase
MSEARAHEPGEASLASFIWLLKADIAKYAEQAQGFQAHRPGLMRQISILLTPSLGCCVLHRLAHSAYRLRWRRLAQGLATLNLLLHRVLIEPASSIGPGLYIAHPSGVVLGGNAGRNLSVFAKAIIGPLRAPSFGALLSTCPRLGDDVSLGANAVIAGPFEVGDRVWIGAGATVTRNVPADTTVLAPYLVPRPTQAGKH